MLIIRLQRTGRKHEPTFRVVLTDSKNSTKSGKFLEILGSYDPRDKNTTKFDGEKIKEWIEKGAQVSDTMRNLLIDQKIIEGKKVNVLPKKSPIKKEGEEAPVAPQAEKAPETEVAPAEEPKTEESAPEAPTEEPAQEEEKKSE